MLAADIQDIYVNMHVQGVPVKLGDTNRYLTYVKNALYVKCYSRPTRILDPKIKNPSFNYFLQTKNIHIWPTYGQFIYIQRAYRISFKYGKIVHKQRTCTERQRYTQKFNKRHKRYLRKFKGSKHDHEGHTDILVDIQLYFHEISMLYLKRYTVRSSISVSDLLAYRLSDIAI